MQQAGFGVPVKGAPQLVPFKDLDEEAVLEPATVQLPLTPSSPSLEARPAPSSPVQSCPVLSSPIQLAQPHPAPFILSSSVQSRPDSSSLSNASGEPL